MDADLNTLAGTAEQASVTVTNTITNEVETLLLAEQGVDTDVFFGKLPTTSGGVPGTNGDGTLHTNKLDVMEVLFADELTEQGGTAAPTALHDVVDPFGDADGNGQVQAFDAAKALQHALNPYLVDPELRAANVDQAAYVVTDVDEFDAALILRRRVGLITVFEVQEADALQHPQPESGLNPKPVIDARALALMPGDGYVAVWSQDRSQIVSGDFTIEGVSGRVTLGTELGDFLMASQQMDDAVRIVLAGAQWVPGPGELVRIYLQDGGQSARLVEAELNGGRLQAFYDASTRVSRAQASFALHANVPNPFNPERAILFDLPRATDMRLEVYDILGQRVRTLLSGQLAAGSHRTIWDGRNTQGIAAGNGTYFYRLVAGDFVRMRRMLLLK